MNKKKIKFSIVYLTSCFINTVVLKSCMLCESQTKEGGIINLNFVPDSYGTFPPKSSQVWPKPCIYCTNKPIWWTDCLP